jgi:hypothetical protein
MVFCGRSGICCSSQAFSWKSSAQPLYLTEVCVMKTLLIFGCTLSKISVLQLLIFYRLVVWLVVVFYVMLQAILYDWIFLC